jgi:hypothetical protein
VTPGAGTLTCGYVTSPLGISPHSRARTACRGQQSLHPPKFAPNSLLRLSVMAHNRAGLSLRYKGYPLQPCRGRSIVADDWEEIGRIVHAYPS